jgi:hypothetical protein
VIVCQVTVLEVMTHDVLLTQMVMGRDVELIQIQSSSGIDIVKVMRMGMCEVGGGSTKVVKREAQAISRLNSASFSLSPTPKQAPTLVQGIDYRGDEEPRERPPHQSGPLVLESWIVRSS